MTAKTEDPANDPRYLPEPGYGYGRTLGMTPPIKPPASDAGDALEGFDAYDAEFVYEHLVGLTVYPHKPEPWLSWDETVKFHKWLGEKIAGETSEP